MGWSITTDFLAASRHWKWIFDSRGSAFHGSGSATFSDQNTGRLWTPSCIRHARQRRPNLSLRGKQTLKQNSWRRAPDQNRLSSALNSTQEEAHLEERLAIRSTRLLRGGSYGDGRTSRRRAIFIAYRARRESVRRWRKYSDFCECDALWNNGNRSNSVSTPIGSNCCIRNKQRARH